MLEAAVAAGVAAAGGEALLGGVLPTPGAPLLIGRYGFDLGVVLSASHNPYRDNGIKFFGGDGFKLSDAVELEIERALESPNGARRRRRPGARAPGRARGLPARAARALRGARPERPPDRARLRQRRDAPRRARDLPPPRRRRRRARGRARRAQHQRRLRLDARRGARRARARRRPRRRLRVRRRRRPRARRRPRRRRRRRRRADRARRAAPARRRPPAGRRRRRDRDDELRLPHRDGAPPASRS